MTSQAKKIVTSLFLIVMPLLMATGLDLEVDYLEGYLEVREGQGSWYDADIGDVLPSGSSIRLSGQGYAELYAGGRKVTLTRDGIYTVDELTGGSSSVNFRQVLGQKFSALTQDTGSQSGLAVGGVRGAEAEGDDFISWEDDTADYLYDGMLLFDAGDIAGARDIFEEGTLWETGEIRRECLFRLGLCLQLLGEPREARIALEDAEPEPGDMFAGEYAVTMGTLLIESRDFDQADEVLTDYLDFNPNGDAAQAAWLLSAYSLDEQGDAHGRDDSLRSAIALGRYTPIGQAAAEMLGN